MQLARGRKPLSEPRYDRKLKPRVRKRLAWDTVCGGSGQMMQGPKSLATGVGRWGAYDPEGAGRPVVSSLPLCSTIHHHWSVTAAILTSLKV